jgi:hypothetical protein
MNKPTPNLTKTCSICGLQKPLTAFLQLAGKQGTIYGDVCGSCRKTAAEMEENAKDGGARQHESKLTIDDKAKSQMDKDKIEKLHQAEESDEAYREKTQSEFTKTEQKKLSSAELDKKRRGFFDAFLTTGIKGSPAEAAERKQRLEQIIQESIISEENFKEQVKSTQVNTKNPFSPSAYGYSIKLYSYALRAFLVLYQAAPMASALGILGIGKQQAGDFARAAQAQQNAAAMGKDQSTSTMQKNEKPSTQTATNQERNAPQQNQPTTQESRPTNTFNSPQQLPLSTNRTNTFAPPQQNQNPLLPSRNALLNFIDRTWGPEPESPPPSPGPKKRA